MVRVVTRTHPPLQEDWGIVMINPLLANAINFQAVADLVREYLVDLRNLRIREIQRLHLGQAIVKFRFVYDRDNLIAMGPQQALGFTFTVIRHNEA